MREHDETTIKQAKEKILFSRHNDVDGIFYGYPAFEYLWKEGRLPANKMDAIRVFDYEGSIIDPHYFTTEDGKLERIVLDGDNKPITIHDPKEILSLNNAPHGWEPTGRYWCWDDKRILKRTNPSSK